MLFLRPYCLLTCFSILLIYFHVRMYRKKFHSCRKELIGILITMIAGNLTQYTFMMFGMCLMLVFGIYEFSQKKWKFAIVHGLIMLQSVIITIIVWPHTLDLLLTRNQMYAAQMPLLWEINFSMLLSVEESTGILILDLRKVYYDIFNHNSCGSILYLPEGSVVPKRDEKRKR